MSRAARRRAERLAQKLGGKVEVTEPEQMIKLQNPVTHMFETFIFANSLMCDHVVEPDSAIGQTVVICGAGPSLADEIAEHHHADQLWACNSALPWLIEQGYPVTHGITVDQTPAMVVEWESAPDVEYLVASTIHPHLAEHLKRNERRMRYFHNFVGIQKPAVEWCECGHNHEGGPCSECDCAEYDPTVMSFEDWMYLSLFPGTIRVGSGLNTATRAIDLALTMGFDTVKVLGADCALRVKRPLPDNVVVGSEEHKAWLVNDTIMHADGGHALASGATPTTLGGEIDGRHWQSKPDMIVSAMFMVRMRQHYGRDRLIYIGDTLPNALEGKSEEFLAKMPTLADSNGDAIPITLVDPLRTGDVVAPEVAL